MATLESSARRVKPGLPPCGCTTNAPAVVEVERQIAASVEDLGLIDRIRLIGVEVFRGLTLDENDVRTNIEDGGHREHIGFDDVLERGHEGLIARELLVPPAISSRKGGADEHLVHGRVELHPRKALGESAGVLGKELRKIRVLEVADPVRHAEVTEIDDWDDVEALQATEGLVRKVPVIAAVSQPGAVDGWAIAQVTNVEIPQEREVCLPMLVMPARLQFI